MLIELKCEGGKDGGKRSVIETRLLLDEYILAVFMEGVYTFFNIHRGDWGMKIRGLGGGGEEKVKLGGWGSFCLLKWANLL